MVTIIDFVVELFTSIITLIITFITDVFLGVGPLTAILFLVGSALTTVAVGYFSLLAAGSALNLLTGWGASAREEASANPDAQSGSSNNMSETR
ncbi:MAG: hypothetical protein J07HQW1_03354 [Haloquadratum walsbyi J07HQW1]|jgi:hypothetical protein|uniref:Uncharacterized protein n=1 Tax=Haloquadratum walsbyi J07HQW1 TaxID=1238424 RepID=U1N9Q4_9EURY|nr:MAG: hypothetical protein J07HQW1_03354 [Haloquadratum walsbyi J07HQW1]